MQGLPFSYASETTVTPGTLQFAMDRSALSLTGRYEGGSAWRVTSDELPIPEVNLSLGPLALDFRVPFGPEMGDLRYAFSLSDVEVGEEVWATLDPQGQLPHDPLSLEMDLNGRMAVDLADLEMAPGAAARSLLESLDLRRLYLRGLGIEGEATGSLSFPGGDVNQPPTGQAQATLTGADGLLSALQGMGWITADDVFQARIGLAAIFGPAKDRDRREANMELRADGSVVVNGVAIP
jgi:hypothetical protein